MSLTSFGEAQPSLAWDFENTAVPYIGSLTTSVVGTGITYPSGKYNRCIDIPNTGTGSPQNIVFYTYSGSYAVDAGFSVAFWLKPYTTSGIFLQFYGSAQDNGAGGGPHITFYMANDSGKANATLYNYKVGVPGTGYNGRTAASSLSLTTFTHVVATVGNGVLILYINGVAEPIATYVQTGITLSSGFNLGSANGFASASAQYDDLRIYNTALSAAQVQSIHQAQGMPSRGVAVTSADLLFYTPFNGTTTDSISSVVPTLTGSVSYDSVNAKYTQSLIVTNTPGANATNYLEYPKTIDIAVTGLTCAFWVRTGTDVSTYQSILSFRGVAQYQGQIRYELATTKIIMSYWNGKSGGGQASASAYQVGPVLSTNTWYHLAIAIKPNGNISFYVNAVEYAAGQNCGLRDIFPTGSRVDSFFVGTSAINPNYQNAFSGEFDDLRLYRYALETPAIVSLYNTASPANFNPPSTSMSGAPLFNQLSQSAASSAVGAFSLRAVNGVTAKAVAVQAHPVVQWPPAAMTSNNFTATGTYNGITNGVYTATSTGTIAGGTEFKLFDGDINTWYASPLTYNISSGVYNGSNNTTISSVSVSGEWVQINLPTRIILRRYDLVGRQDNSLWQQRVPTTFWIAGSNDNGSTWSNVHQQSGLTPPQSGITINVPTTSNSISYSSYRLVVNVIGYSSGQRDTLNFSSWNLYGDAPSYAPNPAQDFYADERGNLLTAPVVGTSLQNWLGGATGYVTKWYDQSGKGNDASQNTAAAQPIIQRATKGPGYSALFNGTTTQLVSTLSGSLDSTNYTICSASRRRAVGEMYYIGTNGPSSTRQQLSAGYYTDTSTILNEHSYALAGVTIPGYSAGSEPMGYDFYNFSQTNGMYIYNWRSGTSYASGNSGLTLPMTSSGNILLGYAPWNGNKYFSGEIFELTIFNTSLFDLSGSTPGTYTTPPSIIQSIYQNQLSYTGS